MNLILSRRVVGVTSAFAALSAALYTWSGAILPASYYGTMASANKTVDLGRIGKNNVKKVPSMEEVKLESLWAEQTVVLTFMRRFG